MNDEIKLALETLESTLGASINLIWIMLGAFLVFFMHTGFAMVEAGFTRSKNAVNILMKNFLTISLGGIVYYLVGFAFMFGDTAGGIIGTSGFALSGVENIDTFVFQVMFAATCATIISGAVAERTNIFAYLGIIIIMTSVIYPVVGHWVWFWLVIRQRIRRLRWFYCRAFNRCCCSVCSGCNDWTSYWQICR